LFGRKNKPEATLETNVVLSDIIHVSDEWIENEKSVKEFVSMMLSENKKLAYISLDESGRPKVDRVFAMGAAHTKDVQEFVEFSIRLRKEWEEYNMQNYGTSPEDLVGKTPKYGGSPPDVKVENLKRIGKTSIKAYGFFIEDGERDNPQWWTKSGASDAHTRMLEEFLNHIYSDTDEEGLVVSIDKNSNYKGCAADIAVKRGKRYGKSVHAYEGRSATSGHEAGLNAADYAASSLRESIETGTSERTDIIGMEPNRLMRKKR
jgi:hypothetical protein